MKRTIIVFIFSGILLSCGPAKKNPSGAAIVNAYEYSIQKKIILPIRLPAKLVLRY